MARNGTFLALPRTTFNENPHAIVSNHWENQKQLQHNHSGLQEILSTAAGLRSATRVRVPLCCHISLLSSLCAIGFYAFHKGLSKPWQPPDYVSEMPQKHLATPVPGLSCIAPLRLLTSLPIKTPTLGPDLLEDPSTALMAKTDNFRNVRWGKAVMATAMETLSNFSATANRDLREGTSVVVTRQCHRFGCHALKTARRAMAL